METSNDPEIIPRYHEFARRDLQFFSPCINERKTENLESMGENLQGIELGHIAWPSSLHHLLVNR